MSTPTTLESLTELSTTKGSCGCGCGCDDDGFRRGFQSVAVMLPSATAAAPDTLASVREFDRYQGKGVPDGRVSLSLRLTFRSLERTLTDAEVDAAMKEIVSALAKAHNAVQR